MSGPKTINLKGTYDFVAGTPKSKVCFAIFKTNPWLDDKTSQKKNQFLELFQVTRIIGCISLLTYTCTWTLSRLMIRQNGKYVRVLKLVAREIFLDLILAYGVAQNTVKKTCGKIASTRVEFLHGNFWPHNTSQLSRPKLEFPMKTMLYHFLVNHVQVSEDSTKVSFSKVTIPNP